MGLNFNCQCFRTGEDDKRAQGLIHILNCRQLSQHSRKLGESQKKVGRASDNFQLALLKSTQVSPLSESQPT